MVGEAEHAEDHLVAGGGPHEGPLVDAVGSVETDRSGRRPGSVAARSEKREQAECRDGDRTGQVRTCHARYLFCAWITPADFGS
ncbi:hypothetical protein NSI01_19110 [Pimelobacter simplex]|nr:hypothetical protein NSI01_19110 [Pimelobacter simplex]